MPIRLASSRLWRRPSARTQAQSATAFHCPGAYDQGQLQICLPAVSEWAYLFDLETLRSVGRGLDISHLCVCKGVSGGSDRSAWEAQGLLSGKRFYSPAIVPDDVETSESKVVEIKEWSAERTRGSLTLYTSDILAS